MDAQREIRIAAVGDIHYEPRFKGTFRTFFSDVCRDADILVLCGDLTTQGEVEQIEGLIGELDGVDIPIVTVLGNHDYEAGQEAVLTELLTERGVHVLDGGNVIIDGVGFAGVKGFGGGFGRRTLGSFGEKIYKEFVQTALDEALKLETALRTLQTSTRVALLHYSPIPETLEGEPLEIFPFLGTSRLLQPIEFHEATVVFHGHAHRGAPEAVTPGGIPVYNVALSLLEETTGKGYRVWTVTAPERRKERAGADR